MHLRAELVAGGHGQHACSRELNSLPHVLHDKALSERDAPIQGCMLPPSYAKLVDMITCAFPNPDGSPSSASRRDLHQAASAAQWIATYNQNKDIPGRVRSTSLPCT